MYPNLVQAFAAEGVEKGVDACERWPSLVLHGVRQGVLNHAFGKHRTEMVPPLEQLARYGQSPPMGIFTVGSWAHVLRHRHSNETQWVAIDWEALIRWGATYMCETGNIPSLAILSWGLIKEAAARRQLPLAELLYRELIQACSKIYEVSYDVNKYPPLSDHEQGFRNKMLDSLFKDKYLVRAIRRNFRDNFGEYTTDAGRLGPTAREQLLKLYPSDDKGFSGLQSLTIFSIARSRGISRKKLPPLNIKGYDQDPYLNRPTKSNQRLYELGHIYRLGNPAIDGVWRYTDTTHPLRPVKFFVVHMGRYAEYRTNGGCDFYTNQLRNRKVPVSSMLTAGVYFSDWFREKYPKLDIASNYDHLASLTAHREIFELATVYPDDLWIVPVDEVKRHLVKVRDSSRGLERYQNDPNRAPEIGRKITRSPKQKVFYVESPRITAMNNATFFVQILSWYGQLYFSPVAWEIPVEETRTINKRGRTVTHKGVFSHPDLDTQFYTLDFLSKARFGGIADHSQVYEWLNTFQYMSGIQLKNLRNRGRTLEKRLYHQSSQLMFGNLPYTTEEAAFIIEWYRPNMTKRDINRLLKLLPGRAWSSIGRQAHKLCKEMIDKGVFDYSQLPHRRKTDAMRIRIRTVKGRMSRKL